MKKMYLQSYMHFRILKSAVIIPVYKKEINLYVEMQKFSTLISTLPSHLPKWNNQAEYFVKNVTRTMLSNKSMLHRLLQSVLNDFKVILSRDVSHGVYTSWYISGKYNGSYRQYKIVYIQ